MPIDPLSLGLTGVGLLGSLFGQEPEMTGEQKRAYQLLLQRAGGLSPRLLELMRQRLRGAVGNEYAGLSAQTASRLRRQDAPIAKQEEVMAELGQRRAGATSGALLDVERLNEEIKGGALSQLASFAGGFPQSTGFGGGFSQLFGAGLQSLLSEGFGSNYDFLSKLDKEERRNFGAPFDRPGLTTMPRFRSNFGRS